MPTPNSDGPDISHWQTLTTVPPDPMWRVYSHKATEGRGGVDKMFQTRWAWMRDQQFKYRGAYHWLRSDSPMSAQSDNLIRTVGPLERGEFIQADWETTSNIAPLTVAQVTEWCDRIEQHYGRQCVIVYTSDWVPGFANWRNLRPDTPLWYANYNTGPGTNGGWVESAKWGAALWQWTSSFVHASIAGRFDMNHIFDAAQLDAITDQTAPVPEPEPQPPSEDQMARYVIQDKLLGDACYWADTLAPVGDELFAKLAADPNVVVVEQDHEPTTAAFNERNGAAVAVALEKFRDSRDGVAD